MNILLFPTRFFPAISGGDFLLEQLGTEYLKIQRLKYKKNEPISIENVQILTSTAIDFAALHGMGKFVSKKHKNYTSYRNLKVLRLEGLVASHGIETQTFAKKTDIASDQLTTIITERLQLSKADIQTYIDNGPILPKLTDSIEFGTLDALLHESPDIIHCTYMPYLNLIYTILIGLYFNIPITVTPFLHYANIRYQNPNDFAILDYFHKIFACTEYEKRILVNHGINPLKIEIVPMGVDCVRFSQKDYRSQFRNLFQPKSPLVLFCGYKNYEKGALSLLKAIPLISKEIDSMTFVFIGPSTTAYNYELSEVKKKVDSIQIINLTPDNLSGIYDKKKIGVFQLADVYCMPSRSDAYGIAYLEAWATKTPVIAADIPAMHEVIEEGKDGILVEFDNINEIKTALLELLNDPQKRRDMGDHGFDKIKKNNSWKQIAYHTLEIYENLINKKNLSKQE